MDLREGMWKPVPVDLHGSTNACVNSGWRPYLDVHHQDKGCAIIVKSPADFSTDDCGINIFSSKQEVCAVLDLEKTFMVQFCCGDGDCTAAGANGGGGRATFDGESGMSSGYGLFLQGPNGTVLQPAYMGLPQITTRHEHAHTPTRSRIEKRSCDKKSWVADDGKDEYTRTADGPQIVLSNVKGPTTQTITKERTQSWTSTLSADIGFEDVLHIGLSFEESFTESITDGKSRTFEVLAGQSGDVGFTAYLHCSTGMFHLLGMLQEYGQSNTRLTRTRKM